MVVYPTFCGFKLFSKTHVQTEWCRFDILCRRWDWTVFRKNAFLELWNNGKSSGVVYFSKGVWEFWGGYYHSLNKTNLTSNNFSYISVDFLFGISETYDFLHFSLEDLLQSFSFEKIEVPNQPWTLLVFNSSNKKVTTTQNIKSK